MYMYGIPGLQKMASVSVHRMQPNTTNCLVDATKMRKSIKTSETQSLTSFGFRVSLCHLFRSKYNMLCQVACG